MTDTDDDEARWYPGWELEPPEDLDEDDDVASFEDRVAIYQEWIDSGLAWRLEGSVGRAAMELIEAGYCTLGPVGHRDYWGNYVPAAHEVVPGTKGSPEYVAERTGAR